MDVQTSDGLSVPIGARIETLLTGLGQTPAWLAEKAGVQRSTVTRILNRERNPTPETLQDLAPVLGVSLDQLVVGTDAAERVREAQNLVSRAHYEEAVHQIIEFERKANNLMSRVRDLEEALKSEQARSQKAEGALASVELERDTARRTAQHHECDARRYREALERAVSDVARLQTQVGELGEAVGEGKRTGRIAAILAGVAAVASVATYLVNDAASDDKGHGTKAKDSNESKTKSSPNAKSKRRG